MYVNNENFILTVDGVEKDRCHGWYVRKDGNDDYLTFLAGSEKIPVRPHVKRPDVAAHGLGPERCGFNVQFPKPLQNGESLIIQDYAQQQIFQEVFQTYAPDALNKRIMRLVEPFVEMDIARVQSALMENKIYERYKKMFTGLLQKKDGNRFKEEVIDILADMKTTMHLLCAAYLDYTRYKDPDFLVTIPEFCPDVVDEFEVDMLGDITGSNWLEPSDKGRWTGKGSKTSLLLPNPGGGQYRMIISVEGERHAGDAADLHIFVSEVETPWTRSERKVPCELECKFDISEESPFLAIHFQFEPPSESSVETRAVKISKIKFERNK